MPQPSLKPIVEAVVIFKRGFSPKGRDGDLRHATKMVSACRAHYSGKMERLMTPTLIVTGSGTAF